MSVYDNTEEALSGRQNCEHSKMSTMINLQYFVVELHKEHYRKIPFFLPSVQSSR